MTTQAHTAGAMRAAHKLYYTKYEGLPDPVKEIDEAAGIIDAETGATELLGVAKVLLNWLSNGKISSDIASVIGREGFDQVEHNLRAAIARGEEVKK